MNFADSASVKRRGRIRRGQEDFKGDREELKKKKEKKP